MGVDFKNILARFFVHKSYADETQWTILGLSKCHINAKRKGSFAVSWTLIRLWTLLFNVHVKRFAHYFLLSK